MLKFLLTIILSGVIPAAFAKDISIYVSPGGSGNGSAQSPTTLQRAIAMLPGLKKTNSKGTITIFLNDGDYNLAQPIRITSENGGTNGLQIVFKALPNTHPVVSGGKKITLGGTTILSSIIQHVESIKPFDLYINGKRAVRARTPNIDHYFTLEKVINVPDSENKLRFTQQFQIPFASYKNLAALPPGDLQKVWFNMYHKWDNTMRTIDSLNPIDTSFYSTGTIHGDWALIGKPSIFYLENYPAALDTTNEWILQNDTIKYIPNEAVQKQEAVIPVLEKLLIIQAIQRTR